MSTTPEYRAMDGTRPTVTLSFQIEHAGTPEAYLAAYLHRPAQAPVLADKAFTVTGQFAEVMISMLEREAVRAEERRQITATTQDT